MKGLAVVGSAAVIVMGFDYATYAATGSSLLLGLHNSESTPTYITNTGAGAPLALIARSTTYPPFVTNAKGLVANLYASRAATADKVGGYTAAQLIASGTATRALTFTDTTGTHSGDVTFNLGTIPAGTYLVSQNAWIQANTAGTTTTEQYIRCYLHLTSGGNVLAESMSSSSSSAYLAPSFTNVVTVPTAAAYSLDCYTNTSDGWSSSLPVTLTFVHLDGNTNKGM